MTATNPVRYPDLTSRPLMTKRGWWLVGLNILVPGSAQLLAGSRRLGRFGVSMTFLLWTMVVVLGVLFFVWREGLLTLLGNSIALIVVGVVLAFYAALWVVLTLDTLRIVRIVRAAPSARAFIAGLSAIVMLLTAGTAAYGSFVAVTASSFLTDVFITAPSKAPVNGRYNIMLLGGDAGPDRDGLRPDSITVASIDVETGQATLIGLPRNMSYFPFSEGSPMAAEYPDGYGSYVGCWVDACMLNSVYTEVELVSPEMYPNAVADGSEPGIEGMRDAVEGITGLEIQYYALIDMYGFEQLIDALGGVEINVPSRVPIHSDGTFTTVAEWIEPGVQRMDGWHALWYARSRHDTDDYQRMERQRQLQQAVVQQFTPANVLSKFQAIAQAGSQVVKTDVPQGALGYFVNLASKTQQLPIANVELAPSSGIDPEDPDYAYVRELVAAATPAPVVEE